jgi:hypothetical protein
MLVVPPQHLKCSVIDVLRRLFSFSKLKPHEREQFGQQCKD